MDKIVYLPLQRPHSSSVFHGSAVFSVELGKPFSEGGKIAVALGEGRSVEVGFVVPDEAVLGKGLCNTSEEPF